MVYFAFPLVSGELDTTVCSLKCRCARYDNVGTYIRSHRISEIPMQIKY